MISEKTSVIEILLSMITLSWVEEKLYLERDFGSSLISVRNGCLVLTRVFLWAWFIVEQWKLILRDDQTEGLNLCFVWYLFSCKWSWRSSSKMSEEGTSYSYSNSMSEVMILQIPNNRVKYHLRFHNDNFHTHDEEIDALYCRSPTYGNSNHNGNLSICRRSCHEELTEIMELRVKHNYANYVKNMITAIETWWLMKCRTMHIGLLVVSVDWLNNTSFLWKR